MLKYARIVIALLTLALFCAGCAEEEPVSFSLPDGFTLESQADGSGAIVKDEKRVGAIVRTDLDADTYIHMGAEKEALIEYRRSYIEPPLEMEYMMGSGLGNVQVQVSLIAYDPQTKTSHSFKHYLFQQDSALYDLWLDAELVDAEEIASILDAGGLVPSQS